MLRWDNYDNCKQNFILFIVISYKYLTISGLVDEMEKTIAKIHCQKESASEMINILSSQLEVAQRLSDTIKNLKEEPSFMIEEDIREEERRTFEELREPKKIIEEVEKLVSHPDFLDPYHMEILKMEIEKNKSFLKSAENMSEDESSKGNKQINFYGNLNINKI